MADTHPVTEGERVTYQTANHPGREDSPAYRTSRRWLMAEAKGGCVICGGVVDLSHPGEPGDPRGLEDHHGGGIYVDGVLVGTNLFPLEWSEGFGVDPTVLAELVAALNEVMRRLGQPTYDKPIRTTADVMAWVDSEWNANVKLCAVHHRATETQHTLDALGHQAVGIHHIPPPVFWYQMTVWWDRFDMWGGTTGTLAVTPDPDVAGGVRVLHVAATHPDKALYEEHRAAQEADRVHRLPPHHPHARLAHAGHYKVAA